MGKRGAPRHMKRIAVAKAVPIHDKKENVWMINSEPGPHPKKYAMPLGVLLRDVLKVALTSREVSRILSKRLVMVDGKIRTAEKFPIGLMDLISVGETSYRIYLDSMGRLKPEEVKKEESSLKLLQVIDKHTIKKGKINLTFHDGRNMVSDNHVHVGDTVQISIPKAEFRSHLKREKGAKCLVVEGKHAGTIVSLKDIIQRKGGKPSEALVSADDREFITVLNYLFVVGE
ncbi:30S ribosomal protein S4e [Candidatus Micrarchaeota archaeon]|nr:30S ribosomal protein S4e [Candidatus Micrarchaeota archaeon]